MSWRSIAVMKLSKLNSRQKSNNQQNKERKIVPQKTFTKSDSNNIAKIVYFLHTYHSNQTSNTSTQKLHTLESQTTKVPCAQITWVSHSTRAIRQNTNMAPKIKIESERSSKKMTSKYVYVRI